MFIQYNLIVDVGLEQPEKTKNYYRAVMLADFSPDFTASGASS
jgi:hypothetical protein